VTCQINFVRKNNCTCLKKITSVQKEGRE